jgi:hypothetical protein
LKSIAVAYCENPSNVFGRGPKLLVVETSMLSISLVVWKLTSTVFLGRVNDGAAHLLLYQAVLKHADFCELFRLLIGLALATSWAYFGVQDCTNNLHLHVRTYLKRCNFCPIHKVISLQPLLGGILCFGSSFVFMVLG